MRSAASSPPFRLSVATKLTRSDRTASARVDDDGRDAGALRFFDRAHERAVVERSQDDAVDALAEEALDDLHLLLAVVFAQRSLPDDVHVDPGVASSSCAALIAPA